jgi:uncharacterized membrane protein
MTKGRLEAFSDGVIAILITIMVLELAQPADASLRALLHEWPHIAIYALSFVMLGIYWNNHHHLFHIVDRINGRVLWTNLHLLFWLSLIPYVTAWVGNQGLQTVPVGVYALVHLLAGGAYFLMTLALIGANGPQSRVAVAIGRDFKGKISVAIYAGAIALAPVWPPLTIGLCLGVALMWLVPDRRIENRS